MNTRPESIHARPTQRLQPVEPRKRLHAVGPNETPHDDKARLSLEEDAARLEVRLGDINRILFGQGEELLSLQVRAELRERAKETRQKLRKIREELQTLDKAA